VYGLFGRIVGGVVDVDRGGDSNLGGNLGGIVLSLGAGFHLGKLLIRQEQIHGVGALDPRHPRRSLYRGKKK